MPDDRGGHRVLIRPDTYAEANLDSTHKGAAGAYNVIEGDWDGQLGSGAKGWVVIDSGAPRVVVRTNPQAGTGNPTFTARPISRSGASWTAWSSPGLAAMFAGPMSEFFASHFPAGMPTVKLSAR